VIPSVHRRGTRVGGLIRYLYGPGKREEHHNPRLVAAWEGAEALALLAPTVGPGGQLDVSRLVEFLEQPVRAVRRPPARTVWHCSVRNHASDRTLSDEQWGHIAREIMAQAGLAPHGDGQAVRWVAVRHAHDHIHIVATLVRQDRRIEPARNDWIRCQAAARDLEQRYGLYRLGPADRTATKHAHRVEVDKAARLGTGEPARDRLRREVRYAAAAAGSAEEFFDLLRAAGVQVKVRHSTMHADQVTGYAVAWPGLRTARGEPVFYSGGRLATDLTLPKLQARWGEPRSGGAAPADPGTRAQAYEHAAAQVRDAVAEMRRLAGSDPGAADALGYAAADALTVTARLVEGGRRGPLHAAAEALDRAARQPSGRQPPRTPRVQQMRAMSRLLALIGQLADDKGVFAVMRLVLDLALLADALADIRDSQQRLHQARAARVSARTLRAVARPDGPPGHPLTHPLTQPLTDPLTPRRDRRRQDPRPPRSGRGR